MNMIFTTTGSFPVPGLVDEAAGKLRGAPRLARVQGNPPLENDPIWENAKTRNSSGTQPMKPCLSGCLRQQEEQTLGKAGRQENGPETLPFLPSCIPNFFCAEQPDMQG
jgi:hypothetical protein